MSDDYEEDFDNYDEDDFEAEEEYDVLPQSMMKGAASPAPSSPSPGIIRQRPASGVTPPTSARRHLDIPATPLLSDAELYARRNRLAASRQKMQHVQLEAVAMEDVFVLGSLTQYELACMARGVYASCKVAAVQTNDDAKEEECQTDYVGMRPHGAQVPDDRNKMSDAEVYAFSIDVGSSYTSATPAAKPMGMATARVMNMDAGMELKLASFMRWAGPVMLASLGMAVSAQNLIFGPDAKAGKGLGAGSLHLSWDVLLAQRPVVGMAASPNALDPRLLVAYGPVGAQLGQAALIKDHSLASKGCLCMWDLAQPAKPQFVMISEGMPTCCALGPSPNTQLVFAGMEEGGVCAWDLDEPGGRHPQELSGKDAIPGRRPSYTTEGQVHLMGDGRDSSGMDWLGPITGIAAVAKEGGGRSTPCSVVAVTQWGEVQVYTASVLVGADGSVGDMDSGMRIGSRLRLLRNAGVVRLGAAAMQPTNVLPQPVPAHCLALLAGPRTVGQLVVGSDGGRCLRGSWVGTPPAPKVFLAEDWRSPAVVSTRTAQVLSSAARCLATSPFLPQVFLAGHANGSVALHACTSGPALMLWPELATAPILALAWSPSRPACFFALDGLCTLHAFDLAKDVSKPVLKEAFMVKGPQAGLSALPTQLVAGSFQPGGKTTVALPVFVLGYDDGSVDVHAVGAAWQQGAGVDAETKLMHQILGL